MRERKEPMGTHVRAQDTRSAGCLKFRLLDHGAPIPREWRHSCRVARTASVMTAMAEDRIMLLMLVVVVVVVLAMVAMVEVVSSQWLYGHVSIVARSNQHGERRASRVAGRQRAGNWTGYTG